MPISTTTTTIPVTPGSGINLDAVQVTVASTAVDRENVCIADPVNPSAISTVSPPGAQFVTLDFKQLFNDEYITLDTANRWNAPVSVGGGVAATVVAGSGQISLATGTTANGYSYIQSQNIFLPCDPGYAVHWHNIGGGAWTYPFPTNAYLFWGFATLPATPTATLPIQDGIGFALGVNGHILAVVAANGTYQVVTDLTTAGTAPTDAFSHTYLIYYRTDKMYWCIDSLSNVVASGLATTSAGINNPANVNMPITLLAIANSTPPGVSAVLVDNTAIIGDTAGLHTQIADGVYPWRKATIKPPSTAAVSTDTALVVQENSGNLAAISTSLTNAPQLLDVLKMILAQQQYTNLLLEHAIGGAVAIPADDINTTFLIQ